MSDRASKALAEASLLLYTLSSIMPFLGVPNSIKALVLCVVFLSLACLYGSVTFYRDPGSVFFDSTRAYERRYSLHRELESVRFRNVTESAIQNITGDAKNTSSHYDPIKSGTEPQICASFITIARNVSRQYIDVMCSVFPVYNAYIW
jgi:hypothetical protein